MVREVRLLWDNPSIDPLDLDRLRGLEYGVDPRNNPQPLPRRKASKLRRGPVPAERSTDPNPKEKRRKSAPAEGRPPVLRRKKSS